MGYISELKPIFVFGRSRNQYYAKSVHLVVLSSGTFVQRCGRAMRVGILGGVVLGQRVAVPAWPAWSLRALGSPSLVLAVVVVCAGVPPAHIFVLITLFCYMRWLCKSPFVFKKSPEVARRNKLLIG